MVESALVVTRTDKGIVYLTDILTEVSINQIVALKSCGEARRLLLERDFDLIIINAPLSDETGEHFARYVVSKGISQVVLIVENEYFDAVSAICEEDGVLVVSKPLNKAVLVSAVRLVKSAQSRMRQMQDENNRLKQKIEDIRVVDRAKYLLISHMNLSEQEAHRLIEKRAMDMRSTRRSIAEGIIVTYGD